MAIFNNTLDAALMAGYWARRDGTIFGLKGNPLRQYDNGHGYKVVNVHVNGKQRKIYVHRYIARLFVDNPENKPEVDHINGDRSDNRAENLRWVTHKENHNAPYTMRRRRERSATGAFRENMSRVAKALWRERRDELVTRFRRKYPEELRRSVVRLREENALPFRAIGSLLGIPEKLASNLYYRERAK